MLHIAATGTHHGRVKQVKRCTLQWASSKSCLEEAYTATMKHVHKHCLHMNFYEGNKNKDVE